MTATTEARPRFACAICGRHQIAEAMTYSTFTGNHYCRDDKKCATRASRRCRTALVVK